jgi:hypothetical protein
MAELAKSFFRNYLVDVAKIIEGACTQDLAKVRAYASQLSEKLAEHGEKDCAKRIQQALGKGPVNSLSLARGAVPPLPTDSESRVPTADEDRFERGTVDIFLPDDAKKVIDRLVTYFKHADQLVASGVPVSCSMLMFGPPGCGKTQAAKYIASELGLPLITARMDGLISSYLGSTSKNLRSLFEHAMSRPCVLFLDEFDAIAKMRDDGRELGELKRVVISLLQNIDAMGKDHVLLAATNHEHLLDPAIWRRFTYKMQLKEPALELRRAMLKRFFRDFGSDDVTEALADATDGLSGAHLRQLADECIRSAVIDGKASVSTLEAVRTALTLRGKPFPLDDNGLMVELRGLNPKQFTQVKLAGMFGVTQPRVSQILQACGGQGKL